MLCLAAHLGAECSSGMLATPNSTGPADSAVWQRVEVGRWGIAIKMDTWTASIVDLSYPLTLSCFWRLDVPPVVSMARVSAGVGPGLGRGGISRDGGCKKEDWDEFIRSLIRAPPSTVMVVGRETWPDNWSAVNVGTGGMWILSGFLT